MADTACSEIAFSVSVAVVFALPVCWKFDVFVAAFTGDVNQVIDAGQERFCLHEQVVMFFDVF